VGPPEEPREAGSEPFRDLGLGLCFVKGLLLADLFALALSFSASGKFLGGERPPSKQTLD
jgi:hypothetical protein